MGCWTLGWPGRKRRKAAKHVCRGFALQGRRAIHGGERLEDRRLLAITAMFDGGTGVLTVTGDAAVDILEIASADNTSSSLTLTGVGTTINGGNAPVMFSNVTTINIDLGGDLDVLMIVGSAGADTIAVNGATITYGGAMYNLTNTENVDIDGGGNGDILSATGTGLAGDLNLRGGAGTDTISATNLTVGLAFSIDGQADADTVSLTGTIIGGDDLSFVDAITLNGDTTLTTPGSAIFSAEVNGAFALTVNANTLTSFGGAVGGVTALTSLTTNAAGTTTLNNVVTTTGAQNFQDNVILATDLTVTASSVTFGGTVNGNAAGRALGVTAGTTTFSGAVGGTTALGLVLTDAAGTTTIGANITTSGTQTYNDNVVLSANVNLTGSEVTFASKLDGTFNLGVTSPTTKFLGVVGGTDALASLITDGAGTTTIGGGAITTTSGQTFSDDVIVSGATTLTVNTGTVQFDKTLNGAAAVTINAETTRFKGAVGGTTALTSLTTNAAGTTFVDGGAISTSGNQSYGDAVTVGANATFTATGASTITFSKTLDGAFGVTVNAKDTVFGDKIGSTAKLTTLTTDANTGGTTKFGGSVTTTGAQIFGDDVLLTGAVTFDAGASDITFSKTLNGPFAAAVNANITTFSGKIGDSAPLGSLTTNAAGTTNINGGAVTTVGNQTYGDNVAVGATTTFAAGGSSTITFSKTLDGAFGVTVNAKDTVFGDKIGGTAKLTSLTTDANSGGTTKFGGNVTTTGAQAFGDDVVLTGAVTFDAGTSDITFSKTLNGAFAATVNANITTFSGKIGDTAALASLTTNAAGTTKIDGGAVTTTGDQTYGDNVLVGAATTFAAGTSNVTFSGKLDGAFGVTVNAKNTTFGGAVGGTTALSALTTDVTGTTAVNGGAVTTTGAQAYGDDVTIGAATTFTANGGSVTFSRGLDGAFAATVNATTTTFAGAVGGTTKLASLTTNAAGTTAVNGGGVSTTGAQTYSDPVTVGNAAAKFESSAGSITFGGTLNGAQAVTIITPLAITFQGAVGGTTALASLTATTGQLLDITQNITTAGAITLTTNEGAAASGAEDIQIRSGAAVRSNTGAITINSADDVLVDFETTLSAQTTVTIVGDFNSNDTAGSTIRMGGTASAAGTGENAFLVRGNGQDDFFDIQTLLTTGTLTLFGGDGNDQVNVVLRNGAENVNITSSTMDVGTATGSEVVYTGCEQFNVQTLGGDDNVTIQLPAGTAAALPSIVRVFGGTGADRLRILGTPGDDIISVSGYQTGNTFRFQVEDAENLQILGQAGGDFLWNFTALTSMLDGGDGNDRLIGGTAADVLFGGLGSDWLQGLGGVDSLFGDHVYNDGEPLLAAADHDLIDGGVDNDSMVVFGIDLLVQYTLGDTSRDSITGNRFGPVYDTSFMANFIDPTTAAVQAAIDAVLDDAAVVPF